MPEIDFFTAGHDEAVLVHLFLDLGFCFVPDLTYDSPSIVELRDFAAYQTIRHETNLFFLLSDNMRLSPLVMFQIGGTGWNAGKYAIRQREGGPSLSFSCYRPYEKNGCHWLPTSSVSHHSSYKNTITGECEKIPKELRSKYHDIVKFIKQYGQVVEQTCIDGGTRKYWVMEDACRAIQEGARLGVKELEDVRL